MRIAALALVLALAGCNRAAADAEWKYNQAIAWADKCEAATEVADAYAKQRDEKKYREWDSTASLTCMIASRQ